MNVGSEGAFSRRGTGVLDIGTDKGAGSKGGGVETSANSMPGSSNSSRASTKIVEVVEVLLKASGQVSNGVEVL